VAHEQFARERLKQGLETWERPAICGLDAWLVSCWQEVRYSSADVPSLLSRAQERALWHEIVEQEHPELFDVSATVRLARSAASLLAEWHIPTEGDLWNEHADAQQFQRWYRLLRRKCRENDWITRADLPHLFPSWLADGQFRPPLTAFVGFEQAPPSLEAIQRAMGSLSVRLPFDDVKLAKKTVVKGCDSLTAEIEFAARRLRVLFEQNSTRSFALFVPELAEQHALVERTLNAVFFPSTAAKIAVAESPVSESLFRVSAAGLLIDQPIVATALLLLNLAAPRIDHADAGAILRSPFITGAFAEQHQRALADIDLRKRRELDVSLSDIETASRSCPILTSCWQKLRKFLPRISQSRSLSEWSELISGILVAVGWPGDRELIPREERMIDQWKEQLSALSSLGLVSPPVAFEGALRHLRRLLSVRLERGEWSSPIQVLDASQANGVAFDSAVAVGLSEDTWPAALRISPLVPLRLQRSHHVPGTTSPSARESRTRLTKALFQAAPEVLVTFNGRLSVLAESFVANENSKVDVWDGRLAQDAFPLATLQRISDGQAPPYVATAELRGGIGIIKAQSQCPFRAFAEYRLNARCPEDASFGFDARERGGFVHKALENVWNRLKSQTQLRNTPPHELRTLVREAILAAVNTKETGPLHQLSVLAERERLEELILEWLSLERARNDPFTVETIEQSRKYDVPGLSLQLRVDRIDRLSNGNLVLIDYKSGAQTRGKLLGERPHEPQLLVYAASVGSGIDGIFFGQLKPREVKAVGFSRKKQFKGQTAEEKKDWHAYIEAGRENVSNLATDFVRGVAEVDPIKGACDYCDNKPFCRVNEHGASQEDEE
jgi:probable DNA repair protein